MIKIKTTVEANIGSMAQLEAFVGFDAPKSTFVTKEEFKTFCSNLFTKLEELKSSIRAPVLEPQANPFTEALKANTEALNALKAEVEALKASVVTKYELKKTHSYRRPVFCYSTNKGKYYLRGW